MFKILAKEFNSFLNSLIAYVVIGVFLVGIGLLMWVFPETSVLDYGYADMETLFSLGPYVLIFLVPAVTMRSFSEEKKAGTIELLITKPLTDWDIILGKFFACFFLVLFALIPTVIYYYSIYRLGNPVGNIDTPGIIGSYIGLALLSGVFCSIGILASSITRNQIIAFIIAAFLCFILFSGFNSMASLNVWSANALFVKQLGILDHYESLSKGLIDSRDVIYFLSVMFIMLSITRLVLGSRQSQGEAFGMANWKSRKLGDWLWFVNGIVLIIFINHLASQKFLRIDLTEENRYSIKDQTREMLQNLEEDVYVEVFLEGELNAGFRRFRKNIEETLEEFRVYSDKKVRYIFTDPATAIGEKARSEFMADLAARGIQPTRVFDKKEGQRIEKIIFPGAIVSYGGFETGVMLLKGNKAVTSEEVINQSVEGVEFELANAIHKLSSVDRKRVGFIRGHGELDSLSVAGFTNDLLEFYDVRKVDLSSKNNLSRYHALIIAKPTNAFSEVEKLWLDQYIMKGGKALFLVDKLEANMDSAAREDYLAFPYELNLDDLLFKYGVRINYNLIQDQNAALHPIVTGSVGGKPQVQFMEWPFFPLINHYPDHPITRNLDAVLTRFISSMDTVKADGVRKTPLLLTSPYSRVVGAPVNVSINELRKNVTPQDFSQRYIPAAYLLEGTFTSLYKNRFLPEGAEAGEIIDRSTPTKIIIVADGDVARNEINPKTRQPQALGFDPYTNYTFANKDFLLNAVAYLVDENGLIQTRSKQVKIRPLDRARIKDERLKWQVINLVIPLVLLILYGVVRAYWRKRRFASFQVST